MAQGVLPFKLETDGKSGRTSLAGLPVYLELSHVLGVGASFERHVGICRGRAQGYSDVQIGMSLTLLQLAGGDCVDDIRRLEDDDGFAQILRRVQHNHLTRKERRERERRLRNGGKRSLPSASVCRRWLNAFCHPDEENRGQGSAFIPERSEALKGLAAVNTDIVAAVQRRTPESTATIDVDATLEQTARKDALFCYEGFRAYAPVNAYWAEQRLVVHTEFRDGNVSPNTELLRIVQETLDLLPEGVKKVQVRSDSAGYTIELLKFMAEGKSERFGVIEFAVVADKTEALKTAVKEVSEEDWQPLRYWDERKKVWAPTGQEWAEVCFVPNWVSHKKSNPDYRFIAVRQHKEQLVLPDMDHAADKGGQRVHVIVTNKRGSGDEIIRWYRQRCGNSEHAHGEMKHGLAGASLPSKNFGANAAWWMLTTIAYNLNQAMKNLVLARLNKNWATRRLKAVRFLLINLPGRVVAHARSLTLQVGSEAARFLASVRTQITALALSD